MRHLLKITAFVTVPFTCVFSQENESSLTFAEDVAPIIYDNCVVCHRPEGVGPFSLIGYEAVKKRARQISEVTSSGFMPPWKPHQDYGPKFQGERRLSVDQISVLEAWAEQGMPPGSLDTAPEPPVYSGTWELGEPDLILEFNEPYMLAAEGTDIYRNFVIPVPLETARFVRAIEFLPYSQLTIHHALVQIDRSSTSRENDELDPEPGFDGMGIGTAAAPEGQLIGWTPGQTPYRSYPGTAWSLEPDSDIVIQLHMLPSGKVEEVSPRIGLYFTDEAPTRSSFVVQMKDYTIDIPPGESNYLVEEEIHIPVDIDVIGLYPHSHFIGKDLGSYVMHPDGSKHWLFRIPDWDFNWQSDYRYETPVRVPAGSTLHMSYSYDNSDDNIRNPNNPAQRIQIGASSSDEMAELALQVLPVDERDFEALKKAQAKYDIDSAGGKALYAYNLGNYFELQGLLYRAINYYNDAIEEDPALASAHFKLGHALERIGNTNGAEDRYRKALSLRPELIPAHIGLARIYYKYGAGYSAIEHLNKVLKWEPQNYDARVYLARIRQDYSSEERARKILESGLRYHESNPYYRLEIGKLDQALGDLDAALINFRYAVENELDLAKPISLKESNSLKSEAHRSIASIYRVYGDNSKAEVELAEAIDAMPHNYPAIVDFAIIAFEAGDRALCLERLALIENIPVKIRPSVTAISQAHASREWVALVQESLNSL